MLLPALVAHGQAMHVSDTCTDKLHTFGFSRPAPVLTVSRIEVKVPHQAINGGIKTIIALNIILHPVLELTDKMIYGNTLHCQSILYHRFSELLIHNIPFQLCITITTLIRSHNKT